MPDQSIHDLKQAIESAPKMTPKHRAELLALVDTLEKEVAATPLGNATEHLRGAIATTKDAVQKQAQPDTAANDPDLGDRLSELEQKVEMVAVEHPSIASILAAIARLA